MSHQWIRTRGLANPTPAVEPGGVEQNEWDPGQDTFLPDDHFSRLHNPQNGRVPPQLPAAVTRPQYPEFPQVQYERFFVTTPGSLDRSLGFQAQSVRVDNYSSHWIFFPSAGIYVPPFIYGAILQMQPGVSVAQWVVQPPYGYSDPTPVLDSNVITLWMESDMVNSPGVPIQSSFRQGASGGAVVTGPLTINAPSTITPGTGSLVINGGFQNSSWQIGGPILSFSDNTYDIGANGANRPRSIYVGNRVSAAGYVIPGNGSNPSNAGLLAGSGAPSAGLGGDGDFYFRSDTPGTANQRVYVHSAGAWVGIV